MLIEKEVIGPGKYWYLDEQSGTPRSLDVTPAETKYWADQGNKMIGLGLPVPVPYEHDFQQHPMTPKDKLLGNAGEIKEYRLKGDTLFSVVDVQDEAVKSKIGKSVRWTSPWISSFTDGDGRKWNNVISHLALTLRPRITKQQPFGSIAAALSMASPTKIADAPPTGFCLSRAGLLVQRGKVTVPRFLMAFSLFAGGIALGDGDMPPMAKKKPPKADASGGDEPPIDDPTTAQDDIAAAGVDGVDLPGEPDFGDDVNDVSMEEILADLLAALDIHVEQGSGESQFKRSLYNAAMQKIHDLTGKARGEGQNNGMGNQPPNGQGNQTPPNPLIKQEQQPMYMSLDEINRIPDPMVKNIALSMYNENVKLRDQLDKNAAMSTGLRERTLGEERTRRQMRVDRLKRMSPSIKGELDTLTTNPSMALSLDDKTGAVVDPMASTLAMLEKSLGDMPRLLTTDQSALSVQAQPTDGEMTDAQADVLADNMARMMGCPPEAKKAG